MSNYHLAQINIACILAPIDDPLMAGYGGLKPCLSWWKSASSRLIGQPEGGGLSLSKSLPCTERAALALRFAPEDHEELIRKGEEFIEDWTSKR
jgi:hypothetical protein